MFSPAFRFLLVSGLIALAFVEPFRGTPAAAAPILAAGIFALGYWRNGTVWLAWRAYRDGNLRRLERRLRWTLAPDHLTPRNRTRFELLKGIAYRGRGDVDAARRHLSNVFGSAVAFPGDRELARSQLADLAVTADWPGRPAK